MKQISVRELNKNISKYLREENLPVQITNRNMVVATIISGDGGKVATEGSAFSVVEKINAAPKPKFDLKNKIK